MAYDATKPEDTGYLAAFPPEMREQLRAIIHDTIVNSGLLNGLNSGNANGNIPVSNGVENTNLNAAMLSGKTAADFAPAAHNHAAATSSSDGFETAAEHNKLAGIATGAEVNQNAFSNFLVSGTTIQADSKTDTLEIASGANITVTPDTVNDKLTIAVTGKVGSAGTADTLSQALSVTLGGTGLTGGSAPAGHGVGTLGNNVTDFNTAVTGGFYSTIPNTANAPTTSNASYWTIYVSAYDNGDCSQLAIPNDTGVLWTRKQNNGTWSAWKQAVTADDSRLSDARTANGGNADTVGNMSPTSQTSTGTLASRDSNGDTAFHALWAGVIKNLSGVQVADLSGGKTLATVDQLPADSDAGHNFTTNGYQKLSSGFIIQWGRVASGYSDGQTIGFPIVFPHNCFAFVATCSEYSNRGIACTNLNYANFVVKCMDPQGSYQSNSYFWIAVGC